jgi:hypothetical protein
MANYPVRGRSSPAVGSFPFGTLMALSLSVGAVAALGWQAWQFIAPLLAPPAVPQFPRAVRVEPLPRPTSLPFSPSARPTQRESPPAVGSLDSTAFPPGSRGRVIEPLGLAIRSKPSVEGAYQGGIGAGEIVTVLEYSADGRWQRVRRELNGQEGWVRAGNLGPVEGAAVSSVPLSATSGVESTPNSTPSPIRPLVETSLAPGERGRVIEPIGLALRATPDREGAYIGGVPMNEVVEVLEYSADGRWQRIRRQNGQEGWVRAGNLAQE